MAENKIVVKGLRKCYGELEVLKKIDIEVTEGEVLCLIGTFRLWEKYIASMPEPSGEE